MYILTYKKCRKTDKIIYRIPTFYFTIYICCIASAIAFLGLEFWKTDFWVSKKTVVRRLQVHLSVVNVKYFCRFLVKKIVGFW